MHHVNASGSDSVARYSCGSGDLVELPRHVSPAFSVCALSQTSLMRPCACGAKEEPESERRSAILVVLGCVGVLRARSSGWR